MYVTNADMVHILPRQTLYDLKHAAMNPSEHTIEYLTKGFNLLNPERLGGTLFEWYKQIEQRNITIHQLANRLNISYEQMKLLYSGKATWSVEQHNTLLEIFGNWRLRNEA